jgi:hypothetical protein
MSSFIKIPMLTLVALATVFATPISQSQSLQPTGTKPFVTQVEASSYPYGDAFPNEFKWRHWDTKKKDHKSTAEKIHKAFDEWQNFVQEALTASSDTQSAAFERWLGKPSHPEQIKQVFANMWDSANSKPTKMVADIIGDRNDFKGRCGARTFAYTIGDTGEIHICKAGLNMNLNSDIKCESLDDSCSAKMRSLPMTLLHEMA